MRGASHKSSGRDVLLLSTLLVYTGSFITPAINFDDSWIWGWRLAYLAIALTVEGKLLGLLGFIANLSFLLAAISAGKRWKGLWRWTPFILACVALGVGWAGGIFSLADDLSSPRVGIVAWMLALAMMPFAVGPGGRVTVTQTQPPPQLEGNEVADTPGVS